MRTADKLIVGVLGLYMACAATPALAQSPADNNQSRMAAEPKTLEEIVAKVNGDIVLKSEYLHRIVLIREELAEGQPGQPALKGAQLEQEVASRSKDVLRDIIDETLMLQKAKDLGYSAELEVVKTMEKLRIDNHFATTEDLEKAIVQQGTTVEDFKQSISTRYLVQRVEQSEVYNKIIITTQDAKDFYDAHQKDFERPAGVSLAQIVVSTDKLTPAEVQAKRKKIEDALAAIKKGDDFTAVAQKYSEDDSASNGGEIGFIEKGQLNKPYEDAVAKLTKKGEVSDIVTMSDAFVILKLEARHDGGVLAFELAQNEISNILMAQRGAPKVREYLNKLREEGVVEVRDGYIDSGAVKAGAKGEGKGGL